MIDLLKPVLEHHKPVIVVFKHRLEVKTQVCNSETYVYRLIVHLACHIRVLGTDCKRIYKMALKGENSVDLSVKGYKSEPMHNQQRFHLQAYFAVFVIE